MIRGGMMDTDKEDRDNIITYETIFELLRKERSTEALLRLEEGFYSEVVNYLKEKLNTSEASDKELISNIKKMIKELYERRERKIIGLALDKCRLGIEGLNTSNMLKEEKWLFDQLTAVLLSGRKSILEMLLIGKEPELLEQNFHGEHAKEAQNASNNQDTPFISAEKLADTANKENTLVRFLHAVPRFVGKELEVYGPFEQEEIANLPVEIARLLIAKARAEEIKER